MRKVALSLAFSGLAMWVCADHAWSAQSKPPEKEQSGEQAGSGGKSPDEMGSRGSSDSPLHKGDSGGSKKNGKKKSKQAKSSKSASAGKN